MMVCAHGNVAEFCREHDMEICEEWNGDIRSYRGISRVIVTDSDIPEYEYYRLKGEMLARGIELISTRYKDDSRILGYINYTVSRHASKRGGRQSFNDSEVIARIRELRAAGKTLQEIRDSDGVCYPDGRKLSRSTIFRIIEREKI